MAGAVPQYESWVEERQLSELSGALGDPPRMAELRREAFRLFGELPLEPNPLYRKYGYFAGVDLTGIAPASKGHPVPLPPPPADTVRIVHDASGTRFDVPPELVDLGVRVAPLDVLFHAGAAEMDGFLRGMNPGADRLTALSVALLNRGYRLTVPPKLPSPLRAQDLTIIAQPHEALSVRRTISVGDRSRLLFSEEVFSSPAAGAQRLLASSVDLEVGASAQVAYQTLHAPDVRTVSLYQRSATVGAGSRLGWLWAGFGGYRTRQRNQTSLVGQGADAEDLQAFYGAGEQAYDSAINMTHVGTDTHGQSITRGVFQDEARGMSRGLVRIEKEARKTVSYLSEHAMLLSKGSRSDTIPILEILCRDVKATHSTSVAPVDPEKVFYLESRGLSARDATRMISEGFLANVLGRAPVANLREILYPYLAARWTGGEIAWREGAYPSLPRLDFASDVPVTDWRFDTKLR